MATISDGQIAEAALQAGLPKDKVAIAVAIALAESGGNPNAHNAIPPDNSYGLWQINMLGGMGPSRRLQWGLKNNEELYNPVTNAKAMVSLSNRGSTWLPWTTYTRGTYHAYMSRGEAAAGNPAAVASAVGGAVGGTDTASGLGVFKEAIKRLMDPDTWKRVALFIVGVALIFFAIMKLTGDNKLSPVTKKIAKAVATKGIVK